MRRSLRGTTTFRGFDPLNVGAGPRNCSNGQTGTDRRFPQMNVTNAYEGPNFFLKLPE